MDSSSDYKISNSSLLSLKAEVLRKQQEINDAKNQVKLKQHAILKSKLKSNVLPRNKGVEERQSKDEIEDEEIMEKSKRMLQSKAALYNKLVEGKETFTEEECERNKQFLVRFDKKRYIEKRDERKEVSDEERHFSDEYEPAANTEEEWVEYTDCLGRTRMCLRKDLDFVKKKDLELSKSLDPDSERTEREEPPQETETVEEVIDKEVQDELTENNEMLSGDMRRELMRREWERQEQELMNKSDIHYQDVLFNEARSHGVGYYAFSKDEEERAKQQENLKKLREETTKKQQLAMEQKQLRERQLAARLKAARNRKRARSGLPPEEDEPEVAEPPPVPEPSETADKPSEKELEEKQKELKRNEHVRPWDIGKEGVKKRHYEYSQEEWVDKQRSERKKEFAPPSVYGGSSRKHVHEEEEPNRSLFFTSKKKEKPFYVNTSVPPPNFKRKLTSINPYKHTSESDESEDAESYDIQPPGTFEPVPIVDEAVEYDRTNLNDRIRDDDSDSGDDVRGKGPEIAPPPTFDYYNSTSSKRAKNVSNQNLEESIAAGLKYLRELSESKERKAEKRKHT